MWHVIFEKRDGRVASRIARSRDLAIHAACEMMKLSHVVRRAIGPNGMTIEQEELIEHYDEGRFPGLR